jgi:serine/threonine protein kinase/tetratricopeptide (TPR) repeat protein
MPAELDNAKSILLGAVSRSAGPDRDAFLAEACGADPTLRREVDELLAHHEQASEFLAGTALTTTADAPPAEAAGAVVGRYRLVERIGEGGMGEVWLAHQTDPVKRPVALKVIKAGMDTKAVLTRFEAERQALALMDHPNIAKVLDGGATPGGRPYFVMELVKGTPITIYCDEHRLTPRQRLELFVPVCQAVQHAHQKGVIHRDLKPSNVLVAPYDGKPVVKVIDFGVAKAAGVPLTEKTLVTGFGAVVGTPEYMSPEQAELNNQDIDTRSDVYSLGILLYELLTGSTPLTRERAKEAALFEVLRLVREEEPPRPSTRLSTTDELPSIAASRGLEPKRLTGLMRGELDWIVMKALEKDRARRYETASAFATDVQRYLHDEPVQACPPSKWYRFRKFTRRNKARLAVAGLILLFILLLGAGAAWYQHERSVRAVALAVRRGETDRAVTAAVVQAETLLAEGNRQSDRPERWHATARLAQVALEKAEELLAQGVATEELTARVRQVRVTVEGALNDSRLLVEADRIKLEQAAQEDRFDLLGAALAYAAAFRDYGLPVLELEPAEAARRICGSAIREQLLAVVWDWASVTKDDAALKRLTAVIELSDSTPWRQQVIAARKRNDQAGLARLAQQPEALAQPPGFLAALGNTLARTDLPGAVKLLREAQRRNPGDLWINHQLAFFLSRLTPPELDEAISFYRAALALRPQSPGVHLNLGAALKDRGRLAEAEAEYRAAIRFRPNFFAPHNNLGYALADMGRLDEALAAFQEAIRLKKDSPEALCGLARCLGEKGRLDESITASREAIRLKPGGNLGYDLLGIAMAQLGRWDEALDAFQAATRLKPESAPSHFNLGNALAQLSRMDEAIAAYREAICLMPDYPAAYNNLGNALGKAGQSDEAIAAYREAIRLKPDYANARYGMGFQLQQQGRFDEAAAAFQDTLRVKPDHANARVALGIARDLKVLNARLAKVLSGERKPANAGERVQFALQCVQPYKRLTATAARFYLEAFAAEPGLAEDLRAQHRYNAACAAAQAGCGQGADAKSLGDTERARLRQQARDWLRADLAAWSKQLDDDGAKAAPLIRRTMQHWSADTDFAGVRGADALAKLPESERQDWQKLWADVADTLARAERKTVPAKKSESK